MLGLQHRRDEMIIEKINNHLLNPEGVKLY